MPENPSETPAHDQQETKHYTVHYPEHAPRAADPHYAAFEAYRKKLQGTPAWVCAIGKQLNDFSHCSLDQPLELHHSIIEFALANAVELSALEVDYPTVQTEDELASFVESDQNLWVLCVNHHRGRAGAHTASYADWEASKYVVGLLG